MAPSPRSRARKPSTPRPTGRHTRLRPRPAEGLRPRQRAPSGMCPADGGDQAAGIRSCGFALRELDIRVLSPPDAEDRPGAAGEDDEEHDRIEPCRPEPEDGGD